MEAGPGCGAPAEERPGTGINLAGATAVNFNGTATAISADQATKITTAVPAAATSGSVTVMTPGGTATSPSPFTVT